MKVGDVMTTEVICCGPEDELDSVSAIIGVLALQAAPELFGGLVMIGGEDTFGAGGWEGSKLEEVLPVREYEAFADDVRRRWQQPTA